jgi:ABC-2 type transport system ATP-binding protein
VEEPVIEVKEVSKRFGNALAVDRLSFSVDKGEILGFLGPNGAGKTTTMRILTGFFPPTEGLVTVGGLDVVEDPLAVRRQIGYLPESVPLYMDMRVEEYLRFVAGAKGLDGATAAREAQRTMEAVNITDRHGQLIRQLSKGFRQRVGLAQAMVGDPPVLILDEPTIGLDPGQIVEIRSLIKRFAGEKTMILSSHILPEVAATCGRVVIINQGRLAAEVDLGSGVGSSHTLRLVAGGEPDKVASLLDGLPGVSQVRHLGPGGGGQLFSLTSDGSPDTASRVSSAVVGAGLGLLELTTATTDLEEMFVEIISSEQGRREEAA